MSAAVVEQSIAGSAASTMVIEGSWTIVESGGAIATPDAASREPGTGRTDGSDQAEVPAETAGVSMLSLLRNPLAVALLLAATLTILSNSIISPGLPGIRAAFGGGSRADLLVPLLVTAPSLLVAVTAPFAGMLADRFGSGRQLLVGVTLFALTGTAGLWLDTLDALTISRLVLGIAVALIMTAQAALVGKHFTGSARTNFMGLQVAATNLSGFVFLLVAGWLAGMSPFLPFAIYAVALLYLPLMRSAFAEIERGTPHADAESPGGTRGWTATVAAAALLAGLSLVGFYLVPTQVPFHLAQLGYTAPSATGLVLAAVTLSGGLVSLAYSRARGLLGRRMTFGLGFAFFTAGFGALSLAGGMWSVLGAGVLIGAATGLLFPAFLQIAIDVAPAGLRGAAAGVMTTAIFIGQFLSPLAGRPLIYAVGYPRTFALTAALFCILGLVSLIVFRDRLDHPDTA